MSFATVRCILVWSQYRFSILEGFSYHCGSHTRLEAIAFGGNGGAIAYLKFKAASLQSALT
jgi:hypothetical protein